MRHPRESAIPRTHFPLTCPIVLFEILQRRHDKRADLLKRMGVDVGHLTRFELECKGVAGTKVLRLVADKGATVIPGLFRGWISFKDPSDTNPRIDRRPDVDWWARMVGDSTPVVLGLTHGVTQPESTLRWIKKGVAKPLVLAEQHGMGAEIEAAKAEKRHKIKEREKLLWEHFEEQRAKKCTTGSYGMEGTYLEYKGNQGKAERTLDRYRASLDAFGRYLKKCRVDDIHYITLQILEGYNQYRTKKEECDSKTAYNDALTIKNAMKWGSRASRGLLRVNPSADWETPKPIKPKRRCYNAEEVAAMETGVREWLRPIVTTLAFTGLRIGELIHLRWVDVDLDKRVIHVRVQDEWKPKGRRDRLIPMHPKVEAVIRAQPVGTHVFLGPDGGRIKQNFALYCLKRDQKKKLKMPLGDLHAFRRFFATTMMKAGVNVESVRQWGGWQSLDTMLRYLADVDVKESVEAMDQAAKRLALA